MQTQNSNFKLNEQNDELNVNQAIQSWLVQQLAQLLSLDTKTINVTEPLTRYGLDSIDAVTLVGDLEDWLDVELPSTLFWDHPTIEKSSQYITENCDIPSTSLANSESEVEAQKVPEPANSKKGWGLFGR
ncbi:phosphopantetheine-binding protein [Aphanothece hegewaldii CCALA 016]|uniref:Phosphopantetheine-binding protein n=1 Tax=Aphanothece hegewaldii CCALA 016 TaxID=2107694 RepID=A0A2T1M2R3_9CHRO|nr:acyl carrier protein [Aphanothece hegewaldii]PSF39046.1 phosphopantetheine-binding protein [Aphanothece hegewaldii CCALA 016]